MREATVMRRESYRQAFRHGIRACLVLILAGCGASSQQATTPVGSSTPAHTVTADSSASPLQALNVYLDGFHFYNGNMTAQIEVHYFCAKLNDDLSQCVIYDGKGAEAHLIGVEYVVSGKLFALLPAEEKKLWHSHGYEVASGQLRAPELNADAEHALMKGLAATYGKSWHTWHTDQGFALPLGTPALMMALTSDGQLNAALLQARDRRLGTSTAAARRQRTDIVPPPVEQGANSWQSGEILQLRLHSFNSRDEAFTTASRGRLPSER